MSATDPLQGAARHLLAELRALAERHELDALDNLLSPDRRETA